MTGMKSHIKIILAVVGAVVLLLFGIGLFIVRKIKQGKLVMYADYLVYPESHVF